MEVIKSIVYQDKDTYSRETKDPSTLYLVEDNSFLNVYFREMKLENVVYQELLPDSPCPDCFYVVDNCLYYVGKDRKTIFKLFDSKVSEIVKSGNNVKFVHQDGSESSAITVDKDYNIYPEEVRSQILSQVGEIDLTIDWDKWGG